MRLRDFNPTIVPVKVATTQHPVMMVPTGDWWLSFRCPCGRKHSVSISVGLEKRDDPRRWKVDPIPVDPVDPNWFDVVTVTPSINNTTTSTPGRECTFHASIVEGAFVQ